MGHLCPYLKTGTVLKGKEKEKRREGRETGHILNTKVAYAKNRLSINLVISIVID